MLSDFPNHPTIWLRDRAARSAGSRKSTWLPRPHGSNRPERSEAGTAARQPGDPPRWPSTKPASESERLAIDPAGQCRGVRPGPRDPWCSMSHCAGSAPARRRPGGPAWSSRHTLRRFGHAEGTARRPVLRTWISQSSRSAIRSLLSSRFGLSRRQVRRHSTPGRPARVPTILG